MSKTTGTASGGDPRHAGSVGASGGDKAAGVASLVLVRHGQSRGNAANDTALAAKAHRLDLDERDADVDLSTRGEEQAQALARHLHGLSPGERPDVVLSSPYQRALRTAQIAAGTLGFRPVVDERLRERELGLFDGWTWYGIEAEYPDEARRRAHLGKYYYRPPGGESWCDVILRVRQLVLELHERYTGRRVWVFTHQAVIVSFRGVIEGLGEAQLLRIDKEAPLANCSLTRYAANRDGVLELQSYGDELPVQKHGSDATHEPDRAGRGPGAAG